MILIRCAMIVLDKRINIDCFEHVYSIIAHIMSCPQRRPINKDLSSASEHPVTASWSSAKTRQNKRSPREFRDTLASCRMMSTVHVPLFIIAKECPCGRAQRDSGRLSCSGKLFQSHHLTECISPSVHTSVLAHVFQFVQGHDPRLVSDRTIANKLKLNNKSDAR